VSRMNLRKRELKGERSLEGPPKTNHESQEERIERRYSEAS